MSDPFEAWPDLLEDVDENEQAALRAAVAANVHEGWEPTREALVLLVQRAKGAISVEEYLARVTGSSTKERP